MRRGGAKRDPTDCMAFFLNGPPDPAEPQFVPATSPYAYITEYIVLVARTDQGGKKEEEKGQTATTTTPCGEPAVAKDAREPRKFPLGPPRRPKTDVRPSFSRHVRSTQPQTQASGFFICFAANQQSLIEDAGREDLCSARPFGQNPVVKHAEPRDLEKLHCCGGKWGEDCFCRKGAILRQD